MRSNLSRYQFAERDEVISSRFRNGETMQALGAEFGITRARVQQILASRGEVDMPKIRATRAKLRAKAGFEKASLFWDEHASTIKTLADEGLSKQDVITRFKLLYPSVAEETLRRVLDNCNLSFSTSIQPQHFSDEVLMNGVLYVLALKLDLEPDPGMAMVAVDFDDACGLAEALSARSLDDQTIADAIAMTTQAKESVVLGNLSLTKVEYDRLRIPMAEIQNDLLGPLHPWPADAQTVMKRLGKGYWSDAMRSVGLVANRKGRSRGLLLFDDEEYKKALSKYIADREQSGSRISYLDYDVWRKREYSVGRTWPSGMAIRNRYHQWSSAVRAARPATVELEEESSVRRNANLSAELLLLARSDMSSKLREVAGCQSAAQRDPLVRDFLKTYAGSFEADRRKWLRAMIDLDQNAINRRLEPSAPSLSVKLRRMLSASPPDLEGMLTDSYLDRTLATGGLASTDGWLVDAAQRELDALSEETSSLYELLRSTRNFLTHQSKESRERVRLALDRIAATDSAFHFNQPITETSLIRWLSANNQFRLKKLVAVMPEIWKSMVAAEGVLRSST